MSNKLPLASNYWKELKSFGNSGDIPNLVKQLQIEPDTESEMFNELIDSIYQQGSCTQAAFAVVPYLVEIGTRLHGSKAIDLWFWVGTIAATYLDYLNSASEDLLEAFENALNDAEIQCIKLLTSEPLELTDTYYLSLAAFALAGHPLGKLFADNYFPYDNPCSSYVICPNNDRVDLDVYESGIVYEGNDELPRPIIDLTEELSAMKLPKSSSNPWIPICQLLRKFIEKENQESNILSHIKIAIGVAEAGVTSNIKAGFIFSLLGSILMVKGYTVEAKKYFHAWDEVLCPVCKSRFVFADYWGIK